MNNEQLLQMPRLNVTSANLKSVGHHTESRTLVVEFHTGAIWSYCPITQQGFSELQEAESKGKYFVEKIKNNTTVTATCLKTKA